VETVQQAVNSRGDGKTRARNDGTR
jgi:hypothetical protein